MWENERDASRRVGWVWMEPRGGGGEGAGRGERGNAFTQSAVLPFEIHSRASCSN